MQYFWYFSFELLCAYFTREASKRFINSKELQYKTDFFEKVPAADFQIHCSSFFEIQWLCFDIKNQWFCGNGEKKNSSVLIIMRTHLVIMRTKVLQCLLVITEFWQSTKFNIYCNETKENKDKSSDELLIILKQLILM